MEDKTVSNQEFSKRFAEAFEYLKIKQVDFARSLGINTVSISQYLKTGVKPSGDITLKLIKNFPQINWYYIYFGEGKIDEQMPLSNKYLENKIIEIESKNMELITENEHLKNELNREKFTNDFMQKSNEYLQTSVNLIQSLMAENKILKEVK